MKKLFIILICCCFMFSGCSKNTSSSITADNQADAFDIDFLVAKEIEEIDGCENFSDETIKSLSIITRTNLINENNLKTEETTPPKNEHILNLVKETENQILDSENQTQKNKIEITTKEEESWVKEIKKVDILKFLTKNKINLTSTKNISPEKDEFGKTKNLNLNGKIVSFEKIKKEFDLPSNNIEYIENNKTNIKIHGKGSSDSMIFNIQEAENLSKMGFGYEKILKNSQNNFQIITRK